MRQEFSKSRPNDSRRDKFESTSNAVGRESCHQSENRFTEKMPSASEILELAAKQSKRLKIEANSNQILRVKRSTKRAQISQHATDMSQALSGSAIVKTGQHSVSPYSNLSGLPNDLRMIVASYLIPKEILVKL